MSNRELFETQTVRSFCTQVGRPLVVRLSNAPQPAAEPADDSAEEPAQEPSSDDTDTPEEAPAENEDIVIDPGEEKSQISCSSISLYDALSPVVFLGLLLGLKRRIQ